MPSVSGGFFFSVLSNGAELLAIAVVGGEKLVCRGWKLLQVCLYVCVCVCELVSECLLAPTCYIPLYNQAPSGKTWVHKQPQICGMKKK